MSVADRFWRKVQKGDACWLWAAGRFDNGYGSFSVGGRDRGAHRVAWELTNGAIPNGLFVLHRCDVPACVNPAHLFLGTQADNMHDKSEKGRTARLFGDRNGNSTHPERRPRGETNGQSKLTATMVSEMRANPDGLSGRALARRYGIAQSQVSRILRGQAWVSHVA